MTISVVIPTHNEEEYLPKTLASIRSQKRKADEVLIVDASSTDKTVSAAKKFGATVISIPHLTVSYGRQVGLEKARGEIVVFTDADAILPPQWLSEIEHMFQHNNVVGIFGGFRVPDGPWWYRFYINIFQPASNTLVYNILKIPFATGQSMAFYKNKALDVGGFPPDFKMAEDIEIARRLMTVGRIIFRQDFYVWASGRRGYEGFGRIISRVAKSFFYYFIFRKANLISFPDIR